MISKETAQAAIKLANEQRDAFGAAHPFSKLSIADQAIVQDYFSDKVKGFVNLNGLVRACANSKLDEVTK